LTMIQGRVVWISPTVSACFAGRDSGAWCWPFCI